MFGNYGAVHFARVGENDITFDQLGKQQLMNGRRGGMDPAQLARGAKLLGTKRPGDDDLGVTQITFNALVVVPLGDFELLKIAA